MQDIEEVKFDRVNTAMGTVQRTFDLVVRLLTRRMVPCRCRGGRRCFVTVTDLRCLRQIKCRPIPGNEGQREFIFGSIDRFGCGVVASVLQLLLSRAAL